MNDDSNSISPAFRKLFPGPYGYFASTDGVDDTFVVCCRSTKNEIAATYYWDDHLPNELVARVTSQALCDLIDENHDDQRSLSSSELKMFRAIYPGPYGYRRIKCPMRGVGYEVYCKCTGSDVIGRYGRGGLMVTSQIAVALNAIPASNVDP